MRKRMKIKSNQKTMIVAYLIVMTIINVIMLIKTPTNYIYPIIQEIAWILVIVIISKKFKKRDIAYESKEEGIYINGSKEGMYDPDFIKYEDIKDSKIDNKRIIIELKEGHKIDLINLGRKIEEINKDILSHLKEINKFEI